MRPSNKKMNRKIDDSCGQQTALSTFKKPSNWHNLFKSPKVKGGKSRLQNGTIASSSVHDRNTDGDVSTRTARFNSGLE